MNRLVCLRVRSGAPPKGTAKHTLPARSCACCPPTATVGPDGVEAVRSPDLTPTTLMAMTYSPEVRK